MKELIKELAKRYFAYLLEVQAILIKYGKDIGFVGSTDEVTGRSRYYLKAIADAAAETSYGTQYEALIEELTKSHQEFRNTADSALIAIFSNDPAVWRQLNDDLQEQFYNVYSDSLLKPSESTKFSKFSKEISAEFKEWLVEMVDSEELSAYWQEHLPNATASLKKTYVEENYEAGSLTSPRIVDIFIRHKLSHYDDLTDFLFSESTTSASKAVINEILVRQKAPGTIADVLLQLVDLDDNLKQLGRSIEGIKIQADPLIADPALRSPEIKMKLATTVENLLTTTIQAPFRKSFVPLTLAEFDSSYLKKLPKELQFLLSDAGNFRQIPIRITEDAIDKNIIHIDFCEHAFIGQVDGISRQRLIEPSERSDFSLVLELEAQQLDADEMLDEPVRPVVKAKLTFNVDTSSISDVNLRNALEKYKNTTVQGLTLQLEQVEPGREEAVLKVIFTYFKQYFQEFNETDCESLQQLILFLTAKGLFWQDTHKVKGFITVVKRELMKNPIRNQSLVDTCNGFLVQKTPEQHLSGSMNEVDYSEFFSRNPHEGHRYPLIKKLLSAEKSRGFGYVATKEFKEIFQLLLPSFSEGKYAVAAGAAQGYTHLVLKDFIKVLSKSYSLLFGEAGEDVHLVLSLLLNHNKRELADNIRNIRKNDKTNIKFTEDFLMVLANLLTSQVIDLDRYGDLLNRYLTFFDKNIFYDLPKIIINISSKSSTLTPLVKFNAYAYLLSNDALWSKASNGLNSEESTRLLDDVYRVLIFNNPNRQQSKDFLKNWLAKLDFSAIFSEAKIPQNQLEMKFRQALILLEHSSSRGIDELLSPTDLGKLGEFLAAGFDADSGSAKNKFSVKLLNEILMTEYADIFLGNLLDESINKDEPFKTLVKAFKLNFPKAYPLSGVKDSVKSSLSVVIEKPLNRLKSARNLPYKILRETKEIYPWSIGGTLASNQHIFIEDKSVYENSPDKLSTLFKVLTASYPTSIRDLALKMGAQKISSFNFAYQIFEPIQQVKENKYGVTLVAQDPDCEIHMDQDVISGMIPFKIYAANSSGSEEGTPIISINTTFAVRIDGGFDHQDILQIHDVAAGFQLLAKTRNFYQSPNNTKARARINEHVCKDALIFVDQLQVALFEAVSQEYSVKVLALPLSVIDGVIEAVFATPESMDFFLTKQAFDIPFGESRFFWLLKCCEGNPSLKEKLEDKIVSFVKAGHKFNIDPVFDGMLTEFSAWKSDPSFRSKPSFSETLVGNYFGLAYIEPLTQIKLRGFVDAHFPLAAKNSLMSIFLKSMENALPEDPFIGQALLMLLTNCAENVDLLNDLLKESADYVSDFGIKLDNLANKAETIKDFAFFIFLEFLQKEAFKAAMLKNEVLLKIDGAMLADFISLISASPSLSVEEFLAGIRLQILQHPTIITEVLAQGDDPEKLKILLRFLLNDSVIENGPESLLSIALPLLLKELVKTNVSCVSNFLSSIFRDNESLNKYIGVMLAGKTSDYTKEDALLEIFSWCELHEDLRNHLVKMKDLYYASLKTSYQSTLSGLVNDDQDYAASSELLFKEYLDSELFLITKIELVIHAISHGLDAYIRNAELLTALREQIFARPALLHDILSLTKGGSEQKQLLRFLFDDKSIENYASLIDGKSVLNYIVQNYPLTIKDSRNSEAIAVLINAIFSNANSLEKFFSGADFGDTPAHKLYSLYELCHGNDALQKLLVSHYYFYALRLQFGLPIENASSTLTAYIEDENVVSLMQSQYLTEKLNKEISHGFVTEILSSDASLNAFLEPSEHNGSPKAQIDKLLAWCDGDIELKNKIKEEINFCSTYVFAQKMYPTPSNRIINEDALVDKLLMPEMVWSFIADSLKSDVNNGYMKVIAFDYIFRDLQSVNNFFITDSPDLHSLNDKFSMLIKWCGDDGALRECLTGCVEKHSSLNVETKTESSEASASVSFSSIFSRVLTKQDAAAAALLRKDKAVNARSSDEFKAIWDESFDFAKKAIDKNYEHWMSMSPDRRMLNRSLYSAVQALNGNASIPYAEKITKLLKLIDAASVAAHKSDLEENKKAWFFYRNSTGSRFQDMLVTVSDEVRTKVAVLTPDQSLSVDLDSLRKTEALYIKSLLKNLVASAQLPKVSSGVMKDICGYLTGHQVNFSEMMTVKSTLNTMLSDLDIKESQLSHAEKPFYHLLNDVIGKMAAFERAFPLREDPSSLEEDIDPSSKIIGFTVENVVELSSAVVTTGGEEGRTVRGESVESVESAISSPYLIEDFSDDENPNNRSITLDGYQLVSDGIPAGNRGISRSFGSAEDHQLLSGNDVRSIKNLGSTHQTEEPVH